jgi:hypothetical protein
MTQMLLDESPLQVLPSLATAVGVDAAIVLQQIYWLSTRGSRDGWVERPYRLATDADPRERSWETEFPWLRERSLRDIRRRLIDLGLIEWEVIPTASGRRTRVRAVIDVRERLASLFGATGRICRTPDGVRQSSPDHPANFAGAFKEPERIGREKKPASQSSSATAPAEDRDELMERRLRDSVVLVLAEQLARAMLANNPRARVAPRSRAWLDPIRLLLDNDGYEPSAVRAMILWTQADAFERSIVLSPRSLRRGAERIVQKMRSAGIPPFDDECGGPASTPGTSVDDLQRRLREQADAARADVVDGSATEVSG